MADLSAAKAALRREVMARRAVAHGASGPAGGCLSEVLAGYRGVPLSGYMPIRSEIDPLPVMEEAAAWGPVGVPVIVGAGQPLVFHRWTPGAEMRDGAFGAAVPAVGVPMVPQILIVPLVAFDRAGGRLGYGGGFYDRTLEGLRARGEVLAIGFAYAAQEVPAVPREPTDQTLDMVVTEAGVIEIDRPLRGEAAGLGHAP